MHQFSDQLILVTPQPLRAVWLLFSPMGSRGGGQVVAKNVSTGS